MARLLTPPEARAWAARPAARTRRFVAAWVALGALVAACDSTGPNDPAALHEPLTLAVISGDQQRAFTDQILPLPVVADVRDQSGRPASGIRVRFAVASGGGQVGDTSVVTNSVGHAGTTWRVGATPGRQELSVSMASRPEARITVVANLVDPADADLIVLHGGGANPAAVVIIGDTTVEVYHSGPPDTVVRLLPRQDTTVVAAFVVGRVPTLLPAPWGGGLDTVTLAFAAPFQIPLTVWILEDFGPTAALARGDVAIAAGFWFAYRFGLEPGVLRIEDATSYAGLAVSCGDVTRVGFDAGTINVYYARNAQIGSFGGFACATRTILMRPRQSPSMLLAHELGHTFGLGHVSEPANFMNSEALGNFATTGQVFGAHFTSWSALNAVYRLHPPEQWCDVGAFCLSQAFRGW